MWGLLYAGTALGYALLAAYFWRAQWRRPDAGAVGLWAQAAVALPLVAHAELLRRALLDGQGLNLGFGTAVSAIVWLTVLIYWLAGLRKSLQGLQGMVLAAGGVAVLLPLAAPHSHALAYAGSTAFQAHLLVALAAYSLFTIAALHAVFITLIERRMHGGALPAALTRLPPLLTLESLLFRVLGAGFVLLTLTLLSGVLFSERLFGRPLQFNHKIVFSIVSWVIFAALLVGRAVYGWRGRVAIRWTLAGFAALVLAYVGSRFVLEVILQRG